MRRASVSSALRSCGARERMLTVLGGAVALVVLALTLAVPFLDEKRRVAVEVPQPAPLVATALVELHGGQRACADEIGLLPGRQVAEVRVGTFGKPAAPLLFTLGAPGYRESIAVAPAYVDNALVDVPFQGPSRALQGSVCIANGGRRKIALYASEDRTKSRSATTVDGRPWPSNFDLAFFAPRRRSLLDDAGRIVRRVTLFHAGVGVGLLWVLCVLFVVGVPPASLAAVAFARRREPSEGRS